MTSKGHSAYSASNLRRDPSHNIPLGIHNRSQFNLNHSTSTTTTTGPSSLNGSSSNHVFKKPYLTVSNPSVKRKPSKSELNPVNKVHLRRQSNSFETNTDGNNGHGGQGDAVSFKTPAPLSERSQPLTDHARNTEALPRLILAPFEPAPWLEFGKVVVGAKSTMSLIIENPSDRTERLTLDTSCRMEEKGFNINQLDPILSASRNSGVTAATDSITLQPRSKMEIDICWTPLSAGSIRASAILKTNNGRFMVNLRGRGDFPVGDISLWHIVKSLQRLAYSSISFHNELGSRVSRT